MGVAVNAAGTRVYVNNVDGDSVSVIDATINTVIATVPVGANPSGVATDPTGKWVYVGGFKTNDVSVIDAVKNTIVATIPLGSSPMGIAVDPAGLRVYVTGPYANTVWVIDTATNQVVGTIPAVFFAGGVAVNAAGTFLYVTNIDGNSLSVIDTLTSTVVAVVPVGAAPVGVALNPAGTRVYITNADTNSVSVVDALAFTVVATVPVGAYPVGIAVNPTGTRVYVANGDANNVSVIDSTTNTVVATVRVGGSPLAFGQFIGPAIPGPSGIPLVVEFYHAAFDHYFITWMPNEIAVLDAGTEIRGWARTGYSFKTYTTAQAGASPVCRYYIPPGLGDSHFFGRGTVECNATGQKNPSFVLEDPAFMQMYLPTGGLCPASTTPVYRVFSNRLDANHRYMTDRAIRDQMVAKGWLAEGDGPDRVVMCAPQ